MTQCGEQRYAAKKKDERIQRMNVSIQSLLCNYDKIWQNVIKMVQVSGVCLDSNVVVEVWLRLGN